MNFIKIEENKFPVTNRPALDIFLNNLPWEHDIFIISGREYKTRRKTCYFGTSNYSYSGITKFAKEMPKELRYIKKTLESILGLESGYFNACLLNLYESGLDTISYHKDDEDDMVEDSLITVLSIGEERLFCLKHDITKEVSKYLLEDLSIVTMYPECQKSYTHAILKETKKTNRRISLTFRRMK